MMQLVTRRPPPEEDEHSLLIRIHAGDETAFEVVFKMYYEPLRRFATSYVKSVDAAHEVVQDVFLRIWERRENWHPELSIRLYLYRAVRNQALNFVRGNQHRKRIAIEIAEGFDVEASDSADSYHLREFDAAVRAAIDELPERRRITFLLHRNHGFTYHEIGVIMDVSHKTVANQLSEALKYIRDRVAPYCD